MLLRSTDNQAWDTVAIDEKRHAFMVHICTSSSKVSE